MKKQWVVGEHGRMQKFSGTVKIFTSPRAIPPKAAKHWGVVWRGQRVSDLRRRKQRRGSSVDHVPGSMELVQLKHC